MQILDLAVPKTVREVKRLLGIVQYYRDLWPEHSRTLAPLYEFISTKNTDKKTSTKPTEKNKTAEIIWLAVFEYVVHGYASM